MNLHNTPIDILMLTDYDWANTGYRFCKSLQIVGLNVVFFKGHLDNTFGYPIQAHVMPSITKGRKINNKKFPVVIEIDNDPFLLSLLKRAKIINFHAETFIKYKNFDYSSKIITVTYSGIYRSVPLEYNKLFSFSNHSIMHSSDLLNLGASDEHLVHFPIDTDFIKPNFEFKHPTKLVIGHFPSNSLTKGSNTIYSALKCIMNKEKYEDKIEYVGIIPTGKPYINHMKWLDNLDRISKCDIYIETCNLFLGNNTFGEFGNTCLEASALGCIVITNSLSSELYEKEYGERPLYVANNQIEIEARLEEILNLSRDEILEKKKKFRQWVEDKHSLEATGTRLMNKIYSKYF